MPSPGGTVQIECDLMFDGHDMTGPARVTVCDGRIATVESRPEAGSGTPGSARTGSDGTSARGAVGAARHRVSGGTGNGASGTSGPDDDGLCHVAFLMPGLIDAHVHANGYRARMLPSAPFAPQEAFALLSVYCGVTAVRDLGNHLEAIQYLRAWPGHASAPRVLSSGPFLDGLPLSWPASRLVTSDETAQEAVRRLAGEGMDWVKVYRSVAPQALEAVVRAARAHDLPVALHPGNSTAAEGARAGVRSVEHVSALLGDLAAGEGPATRLREPADVAIGWSQVDLEGDRWKRLQDTLVERGTWVCPTLLAARRAVFHEEVINSRYLPQAALVLPYHKQLQQMRLPLVMRMGKRMLEHYLGIRPLSRGEHQRAAEGLSRMAEATRSLHAAGVPMAAGSDAAGASLVPGYSLHEELGELSRAGLDAADVLRMATAAAARLLARDDLGVIRPGARADLICMNRDPTADMTNLPSPLAVMIRGQWVDRNGLLVQLRETEEEDQPEDAGQVYRRG